MEVRVLILALPGLAAQLLITEAVKLGMQWEEGFSSQAARPGKMDWALRKSVSERTVLGLCYLKLTWGPAAMYRARARVFGMEPGLQKARPSLLRTICTCMNVSVCVHA